MASLRLLLASSSRSATQNTAGMLAMPPGRARTLTVASPRMEEVAKKDWFKFLLRVLRYDSQESVDIRSSHNIVRSCVTRGGNSTLIRSLDLGKPSFMTEHQLLLVHIWLANKRIMLPGAANKQLQKELFYTLWENTERRIRARGINELSVNKHLGEIQRASFGGLVAYDKGFAETTDGNAMLASSVQRNLFHANKDVSQDAVRNVAQWMRSEVDRLGRLSDERLRLGELEWTYPNGIVETEQDVEAEVARGAAGEWRCAMAVSGKAYWWNIHTREALWERPQPSASSPSVDSKEQIKVK